eukprot:5148613-Prymnesium_polylepis.1
MTPTTQRNTLAAVAPELWGFPAVPFPRQLQERVCSVAEAGFAICGGRRRIACRTKKLKHYCPKEPPGALGAEEHAALAPADCPLPKGEMLFRQR